MLVGPQLEVFWESHDFGPVCYLAISKLLEKVKPQASRLFAARGLTAMNATDFRKDYEPLMDRRFVVGGCLHRVSEVLRELKPKEIQEISSRLPDTYRPCLRAFADELHRDNSRSIEQATSAALERCWDAGLRQLVESQLRRLRDRDSSRVGLR